MDPLLDTLDAHTTLLTPNRRLARALAAGHAARRRAQGGRVWETPDILPWPAWLRRCWDEAALAASAAGATLPALLSPWQERALWEQAVRASGDDGLLAPAGAARLAQEAWQRVQGWGLGLPWPVPALDADARAFQGWALAFTDRCEALNALDGARLPQRLDACLRRGHWQPPRRLALFGFEELAPRQRSLLDALRDHGCEVRVLEPDAEPGRALRLALPTARDEARSAAAWARERLERNPRARIGIVAPELAALRPHLRRALDAALDPRRLLAGEPASAAPYDISLGLPLGAHPLVHDALLMLDAAAEPPPLAALGRLLRSPFLAGGERELDARALLEARLRRAGAPTPRWGRVLALAREAGAPHACPLLAESLAAWLAQTQDLPARERPGRWAERFARLLQALGWPGGRGLESAEFQALEAWRGLLGELGALDRVLGPVPYREAVARLRRLADETVFQPRSAPAPVQVLGVLEAAGLRFDHLWVMGLSDEVWPPPPQPNPLIPIALQRRQGLPRACAERELAVACRLTRRLLAAAPEVMVSHPRLDGERELRPSPLIAALPEASLQAPGLAGCEDYARLLYQERRLEAWRDARGPALAAGRAEGGSHLLAAQAACPFQAFAAHRLDASPLEDPKPGLDAATRGALTHAALERLWHGAGHELLAAQPEPLAARIRAAVAGALAGLAEPLPGERLAALERERLEALLAAWLDYERGRQAPFSAQVEACRTLTLGGLTLSLRLDRLDTLADGRVVVIDYKTGKVGAQDWLGERPQAPQLPLYALAWGPGALAALAFAQVRAEGVKFIGLAQDEGMLPDVGGAGGEASWEALIEGWRETLTRLAEAFLAGDARVDPLEPQKTCKRCGLTALCRVHERDATNGGDDERD